MFWTTLGGDFTATNVFTTLSAVSLIGVALDLLVNDYYMVQNGRAAMQRVEEYLALEEYSDPRQTNVVAMDSPLEKSDIHKERQLTIDPPNNIIELLNAHIAVQGLQKVVLPNLNLGVKQREVVMVIGPTASGKSTLLKAILGEIELISGSLYVKHTSAGYCDQTPWIWNGTIQENIIGNSPIDMDWYDMVITACLLKPDLAQLPQRDQSRTGSNGGNLSGGQKQRVVCAFTLTAAVLGGD